ncbi:MAG: hypothetical protein ACYDH6_17600 [Acidimicrobiales bacterium]
MAAEQLRFISEGDRVYVTPSGPGRRDGFDAVVRSVDGEVVTVWGGRRGHESWRTVARSRVGPARRTRR